MKNLVRSADFILLPTTSRSIELTIEMAQMINKYKIPYAALLVKVDSAKRLPLKTLKNVLKDSTSRFSTYKFPC